MFFPIRLQMNKRKNNQPIDQSMLGADSTNENSKQTVFTRVSSQMWSNVPGWKFVLLFDECFNVININKVYLAWVFAGIFQNQSPFCLPFIQITSVIKTFRVYYLYIFSFVLNTLVPFLITHKLILVKLKHFVCDVHQNMCNVGNGRQEYFEILSVCP